MRQNNTLAGAVSRLQGGQAAVVGAFLAGLVDTTYLPPEGGACEETDPEAFFPEKGDSNRGAKRVCAGCDIREACLEWALTHDERFGVWGGMSTRDRDTFVEERRRRIRRESAA